MAGLLGDGFDDPRSSAIMALAGGLLQGNFGGGLLGANNAFAEAKQNAAKKQYMDMQLQNMQSEMDARKLKTVQDQRQQKLIESFFPGLMGGEQPASAPGAAAPIPSAPMGGGAPMGSPSMAPAAPQGGNDIMRMSQHLGIPPQAIQADLVFNGGKKISEMLAERSKPNWQNINGNLVNTNAPGFSGGFQPGFSVSSDGKAVAWQPNGQGGLVFGAPQGALQTFGAYQNVQEGTKANFDPMQVTPQGENPQMTTRGALVSNPLVNGRVSPQEQAQRDQGRNEILTQELTKARNQLNIALGAGDQSAAARAQADIAALQRELGGRRPSVGMPLQSEEEKLRASEGVKADATRNQSVAEGAQKSKDTLANIAEARRLLQQGPTSSGIGSLVDTGANFFGTSTKGADVAAKLDTLSGWMVNNVPRMEGPQSNFDVQNYKTMAGLVGDRTKPLSQRMAALDTLEGLQRKYAALNTGGNAVNSGGATGDFGAPSGNVINELPKMAPKGQRVRDTQTGKVLQFNGMSWVEVK